MFNKHLIEIFVMLAGSFVLGYLWRGVGKQEVVATVSEPDDLKQIFGITKKVEEALFEAGIYSYKQLAATNTTRLDEIMEENGIKKVETSEWPREASNLMRKR